MPEMKIAFRSTDQMKTYDDRPKPWIHGTVRLIDKQRADHLCKTFPNSFFPAGKFKAMVEADFKAAAVKARAELEEKFGTAPGDETEGEPSLDPVIADKLKLAEIALWKAAAIKADAGEDLTSAEQKILDRVDKLSS